MGCPSTTTQNGNPSRADIGYSTPVAPYDKVQFYANMDELEDNANFASWEVHLLHADTFTIAWPNVMTLVKDTISGSDYRFYIAPWTVDENTPSGCYRIVIIDGVTSDILYLSNVIEVLTLAEARERTIFVRYRNRTNIQNFNYEGLGSFYNVYRVWLQTLNPQNAIVTEGYEKVNGSFERVRTQFGKTKDFQTGWLDTEGHEALNNAMIHSDFQIWQNSKWNSINRPETSDYQVDWIEGYPVAQARITLEEVDNASTNRAF